MENRREFSYMKVLDMFAAVSLFIGGLNWGLMGLFDYNLLATLFGSSSFITRVIYVLFGAAALYDAILWNSIQRRWECVGFFSRAKASSA
jgi:hypothetical protein